jgi:3-deoxy-D-manno-octulosonic-acid transferase
MVLLYDTGILLLRFFYLVGTVFIPKARTFRRGRHAQVEQLGRIAAGSANQKIVWFHCASLGEFEQGRPLIEALKQANPAVQILLTFFSPSGYEIRKNYELADYVLYLPWDTRRNARRFAEKIRPSLAIFVKYEFWYHYSIELRRQSIPLISVSCIFRPDQVFFKTYGALFRKLLRSYNHFFVQNQESLTLLQSIGISEATVAGDTRFDRVNQIVQRAEEIPAVKQFKATDRIMVVGSAWPEDMEVLFPFINENKGRMKFIIAPHEISESFLTDIEKSIEGKSIRYSKIGSGAGDCAVLIIDNIGLLSRLYRYGDFAFVGGAFKQGLHNILEAACYGIPIFFGNVAYQKYQEAVDLVLRGGAFDVGSLTGLKTKFERMMSNPQEYQFASEVTRQYVLDNLGATKKIVDYCNKSLL